MLFRSKYLSAYDEAALTARCHSNYFMDATPGYLRQYNGAVRMQAVMPTSLVALHSRHLVILREPLSRDLSFYNMFRGEFVQKSVTGDVVPGLGSVQNNLCGKVASGDFPSYASTVACEVADWKERCLSHQGVKDMGSAGESLLMQAYRECADGSQFAVSPSGKKARGREIGRAHV